MAVINPITGLKRRMPRRLTSRKKRKTTSSIVAGRMIVEDTMEAYFIYMMGHKKALLYLVMLFAIGFDFSTPEGHYLKTFLLLAATSSAHKTVGMLRLDSEIMDLRDEDPGDCGARTSDSRSVLTSHELCSCVSLARFFFIE
jgi:hypothetical protein